METNFFVGQEVVAIKDHSQGNFKKGNEFVIRGIKEDCCLITLDVGIKTGKAFMNCRFCGNRKENDNYYDSNCFSPKYASDTKQRGNFQKKIFQEPFLRFTCKG